jgi:hypothetical protein
MSTLTEERTTTAAHPDHLGSTTGRRSAAAEKSFADAPVGTICGPRTAGGLHITKGEHGWFESDADGNNIGGHIDPYHHRSVVRWGAAPVTPEITEDTPVLADVTATTIQVSLMDGDRYTYVQPGETRRVLVVRKRGYAGGYTYVQVQPYADGPDIGWHPDSDVHPSLRGIDGDNDVWRCTFIDNSATVVAAPVAPTTPAPEPEPEVPLPDGAIVIPAIPPKVAAATTPPRGTVVRVRLERPSSDMTQGDDFRLGAARFPRGPWPREYDAIYDGPSQATLLLTAEQGRGWSLADRGMQHSHLNDVPRTGWTVMAGFTVVSGEPAPAPLVLDPSHHYTAEEVAALVTAERDQHLKFRDKVRQTAIQEGIDRGWCTEMDQVLVKVGLPPRVAKRVTISYRVLTTTRADLNLSEDTPEALEAAARDYIRRQQGPDAEYVGTSPR